MTHAQFELDLLEKTVKDAIVTPFKNEILQLVEKVFSSGQSGGSMPYTAQAVSGVIKSLLNQQNICPITGEEWEWNKCNDYGDGREMYQNNRLSSIFKDGKEGRPCYINAIIFQGEEEYDTFTSNGSVTDSKGNVITSKQYIKEFPFKPKTFYIDVISHRYDKNKDTGELVPNPEGDWWEHDLKDESQLEKVFEYYDRFE